MVTSQRENPGVLDLTCQVFKTIYMFCSNVIQQHSYLLLARGAVASVIDNVSASQTRDRGFEP